MAVTFPTDYDEVYLDGVGTFEMTDEFSVSCWIYTTEDNREKTQVIVGNAGQKNNFWRGWGFYLDTLNRLSARLIHSLPHNYIHTRTLSSIPLNQWTHVAFSYDGSGKAAGIRLYINGELGEAEIAFDQLYKSIYPVTSGSHERKARALRVGKSYRSFTGEIGFFKGRLDEMRIYNRSLSSLEMAWLAEAVKQSETLALEHKIAKEPTLVKKREELRQLRAERLEVLDTVTEVMVMEDMPENRPVFVLNRGVYDQPAYEVEMGTLSTILDYSGREPEGRQGLAQWLFDEKNPLTARVAVNRYWQLIFGRGLVSTPQDFGSQGALPSHPELLDHLAVKFRDSSWDLKALVKEIVMSYTYRQSSKASASSREQDPANIWLSHSPSYRLPAEMIRDNALAASGLLAGEVGGPSVKPYQPEGLWIELGNFSHELLRYKEDEGKNLYRRSLYTFIRRTSPPPFMTNFDVPNRDRCTVQRESTNTPMQALNLLNDPQFVEAARALAVRIQKEGEAGLEAQLTFAFRAATGRRPSAEELVVLNGLFEAEKERFQQSPTDARQLLSIGNYPNEENLGLATTAALAVVANTILNHDEAYMKR